MTPLSQAEKLARRMAEGLQGLHGNSVASIETLLPLTTLLVECEERMTKVADAATIHCRCDMLVEPALTKLRALMEEGE